MELTNQEKDLIKTYLARLTWDDIRKRSENEDEAYLIQQTLAKLRNQL